MSKLLNIFIITLLACPTALAAQLPAAADVDNLSGASAAAFDTFITETFTNRYQMEYSGRLIDPNDAQKISASAIIASTAMTAILKSQEIVRYKIELYEGDDWDELYGKTSLWRTSVAAARQTRWRICVVDYHHAIASTGKKRQQLLKKVIARTSKDSDYPVNEKKLLNIRTVWAAAPQTNTRDIIRRLDSLIAASGIDNEVFYQAVIMRMKLSRRINAVQLNALADSLNNSKLNRNFELLFKLALQQLKAGSDSIIKSIARKHPAAADIAARIILADIAANASDRQSLSTTLNSKTPPEINLAAVAAIKEQSSKYAAIFEQICKIEKFQSRLTFLAAAQCTRSTQPAKAVAFYTAAAKKTSYTKDTLIDITRSEIARTGARLAYELYYKDSKYLTTAKEAIENYIDIAGNRTDEELAYLYGSMIIESGEGARAVKFLSGIVSRGGKYADLATLDLIFYKAKNSRPRSPLRKELIAKLKKIVSKPATVKTVYDQAQRLYCKLIIEEGGKENAETVLAILEKMHSGELTDIAILKAAALAETGRLVNAAETLATIATEGNSKGASLAVSILAEILDEIDEYEDKVEDFDGFIKECLKLARFAARSIKDEDQVLVIEKIYVEICIIEAQKGSQRIAAVQSLLNKHSRNNDSDIDWMRCRARLFFKQGRYAEAFSTWSAIAQARKPRSRSVDKPKRWWRAKYYALKSYSKISTKKNSDLPRAIQILINTNKNIPQFWNKKLTDLKKSD